MKAKSLLFISSCLLALTSCGEDGNKEKDPGRDLGSLHLSKENPEPGDTILLTYSPENEAGGSEVVAYFDYFVDSRAYPQDVEFTDSSGVWKAKVVVPDSAVAVAFNIKLNEKLDSNNKAGYALPLYDEEGNPLPGSKASLGYFYSRYGSQYEVENDSAVQMIQKDLETYPELKEEWDLSYAYILTNTDKDRGEAYVKERIAYYSDKEDLSEEDYTVLSRLYNGMGNREASDSISALARDQFPAGELMMQADYRSFAAAASLEEKEEILEEFMNKYGNKGENIKNYMISNIASTYAANGNFDKFREMTSQISDKTSRASAYNSLAWDLAEKGENLKTAAAISKESMELIKAGREGKKPDYMTRSQFQRNLDYSYSMYADTYALIQFKQGNLEEAIKYQEIAVGEGKDSELNERYLQFLVADEEFGKAAEKAENFIQNNTATAKAKEYYEQSYTMANGSAEGFGERLAALEEVGYEKALAKVKSEMIDEEAPDFSLMDLEGKEVALSALKGKTLILDFWATWCGPCKASFPGMQIAVDKYKDDESVEFLFVNTMEDGEPELRKRNVSSFIDSNDYSFHVVMDQPKEPGSRSFKTAADYNVNGIPTKVVIGPDSRLKFVKVGYGGNNERMVQELDMMIELTRS